MPVRLRFSRWHRAQRTLLKAWNSAQCSFVIGMVAFYFTLWAAFWYPSPGKAIAVLGAAAAVMSLRPEMRLIEKAGWMVIITALLFAEFHSIRENDIKNFNDRKDQIDRLVALTTSNKQISDKIDKFTPRSTPIYQSAEIKRPTIHIPLKPTQDASTPVSTAHNPEDERLIEQMKGIIAANKVWGMSKDQLIALSREETLYASDEERNNLITVVMSDAESQKFGDQLVGVFRAAGWKLSGLGKIQANFSERVTGIRIVINSRESNPPGMAEFVRSLRSAGIEPIGEINPQEPPNKFSIIVGSKPD